MNKPDLDNCTLQEACDYAVFKIVEQGGRCMIGNSCAYEDEKGNHCAIGWLLDHDNELLMRISMGIEGLADEYEEHLPRIISKHLGAFSSLQCMHDEGVGEWRDYSLGELSDYIDTTKPQYKQWVEMSDE